MTGNLLTRRSIIKKIGLMAGILLAKYPISAGHYGKSKLDPYRQLIASWLLRHPPLQQPELSLMNVRRELSPEDVEAIRHVGCNTILHTDSKALAALKKLGFKTSASATPVRMGQAWAKTHPEQAQERYLLSKPQEATEIMVYMDIMAPYQKSGYELDLVNDPKQYWRVFDRTSGTEVAQSGWIVDPITGKLTISNAITKHIYQAAFLVYARNVNFFGSMLDPIYPEAEKEMLRDLSIYLNERSPYLDIYRPTSLFYPFPQIRADSNMAQSNWWAYQWGAGPVAQKSFEKETGIRFNPSWLVDEGRFGHIDYPPQPEYLTWMHFQQGVVIKSTRKVVELAHGIGAKVQPFWGDHWMGMEPYLDFFERTGTDQIVKACNSAQVCRMVTDIPAKITKIIRFSPWLGNTELFSYPDPPGRVMSTWTKIKRATLFCVPDGLSWGGENTLASVHNDEIAAVMKATTDEFRLIHALVGGQRAFRHPGKVYILNAWGKIRSWAIWQEINPSQDFLLHFTDLPINVEFLSLREVAEKGVPADAMVLINAGEPGSSWSGGFYWDDPALVKNITRFVERGGGLIGIDSPSYSAKSTPSWRLSHLFGLAPDGFTDEGAAAGSYTLNDHNRLGVPNAAWTEASKRTAKEHWISQIGSDTISNQRTNVRVKSFGDDVLLLYSGDGQSFAPPVVTCRKVNRGRTVYFNGVSMEADYGQLLRRSVYWAGGIEEAYSKLYATPAEVLVYLYPEGRRLFVFNTALKNLQTKVYLDVRLMGIPLKNTFKLHDTLTETIIATLSGVEIANGFDLEIGPSEVRFLEIKDEN